MMTFVDTPGWDRKSTEHMWAYYLPRQENEGVPPYAAPARADNLSGLPRTYIMTAEMDPLRDEGLIYGSRLLHAGVSTEVHNFSGTFHAFDTVGCSKLAKRAIDEQIRAFQRFFH